MKEKIIDICHHCYDSMKLRGVSEDEVIETIRSSEWIFIEDNRYFAEKEFIYRNIWYGHWYLYKKVKIIFAEEEDRIVAITSLSFYY